MKITNPATLGLLGGSALLRWLASDDESFRKVLYEYTSRKVR